MLSRSVSGLIAGCVLFAVCPAQQLDTVLYLPDSLGYCDSPISATHNPLTNRVYVVNGGDVGGVLVFDPATRTKERFLRGRYYGAVFCPGVNRLFLCGDYRLTEVDARADTVLRSLDIDVAAQRAMYNPASNRLYFRSEDEADIYTYDLAAETAGCVATSVEATDWAWDSVLNRIYLGSDEGVIEAVDCWGDTTLGEFPISETWGIYHLALNTPARRLYCQTDTDTLFVVDADSLRVANTINLLGSQPMVYNPVYNRLYCPNYDAMVIVDCAAETVRVRRTLGVIGDVTQSSLNGRVYVGLGNPPGIVVLDAGDTVAAAIGTGNVGTPGPLDFAAARNELYCPMRSDWIALVDCRADTVSGWMDYSQYIIRGMVHNPVENKLYLVSPHRDEVMVLDRDYRQTAVVSVPMLKLRVFPLFNPGLNRLYLADSERCWVIDCGRDSLLGRRTLSGLREASTALLVQSPGKVYVFSRYVTGQHGAWVYDCLRDTVTAFIPLGSRVVSAAYHPWSNCVYASVVNDPSVVAIDASADTVVAGLRAGRRNTANKLFANPLNGRVYHAVNVSSEKLVTLDVRTNTVVDSVEIGDDADTIFWYPRQNKLYLCDRTTAAYVKAFDCNTGQVTTTLPLACGYAGALNEATERLCLGDAETLLVLDCRIDEVVSAMRLPSPARLSAVNAIDNRVYFADRSNWVAVVQDRLGVEEESRGFGQFGLALMSNPVRNRAVFRCQLLPGERAELLVYDASGRRVNRIVVIGTGRPQQLVWSRADVKGRSVGTGVYFARLESGRRRSAVKVVVE